MNAVFDTDAESPLWEPSDRWEILLARAFDACAHDAGSLWPNRPISVLLCDDARIRQLNREWRGVDRATNVLSFPAVGTAHRQAPLGDIAIAFETVAREAAAEGVTAEAHFTHLAVHGLLHLLGMDHQDDDDACVMEAREIRILASLGVADPYARAEALA